MAGNKKTRKKAPGRNFKRRGDHVTAVLNRAIEKFYIMGDMNHAPASFHVNEINTHLKPNDAAIALGQFTTFAFKDPRAWMFAVYHFFNVNGNIEVIPTQMTIEDTTLAEVGDLAEENIKLLKDSIIGSEPHLTEDNYIFYGYYINYAEKIRMDKMEEDIISVLFKVNNDFTDIKEHKVQCTTDKIIKAIGAEKFKLIDNDKYKTNMELVSEELA